MSSKKKILFYLTAAVVLIIDQVTKAIARGTLHEGSSVTVIPGFFDLRLSYNSGAAFGALPNWAPLFILVALVAVYAIVKLSRTTNGSRSMAVGFGLLLGGALGNLLDRIVFHTRGVTDFLSLHINFGGATHAWPTFNVADIAIVAGAILTLINVYILEKWNADREDEA